MLTSKDSTATLSPRNFSHFPTPPLLPEYYFSVRDLTREQIIGGYKFTAISDIPCHLFFRWTTVKPQKHTIPVYKRGLFLHGDTYFCFVTMEDNEQEEAGDTLIHTFIKLNWQKCQTRWWYFWGTINSVPCRSTTGLFEYHAELDDFKDIQLLLNGQGVLQEIPTEWPRGYTHWLACYKPPADGAYFVQHNLGANWKTDFYNFDSSPLSPYTKLFQLDLWTLPVADYDYKMMRFALYLPGYPYWFSQSYPIWNYGHLNPPANPKYIKYELQTNPITGLAWEMSDLPNLQYGTSLYNGGIVGSATTYHMYLIAWVR